MKNLKVTLVALILILGLSSARAQGFGQAIRKFGLDLRNAPWVFGAHWSVIKDDGYAWRHYFAVKTSWNLPAYPSRLSVEKYYKNGFSFEFNANFTQLKPGKLINSDIPLTSNGLLMYFDLNAKYNFCDLYDFNQLLGIGDKANKRFDLLGIHGWGFTYRSVSRGGNSATFNLGFGGNVWVYEGFGVQIQALAKFGLVSPIFITPANYLNYSIGIIYKFKPKPMSLGKRYKFKKGTIKQKI
jgi:OOP family OmpA-OmpF porin